ncbi:hypothetical protein T4D_16634 [Trichinella pseudospiralis]|uniref:Uncharacterized protein n=1 Tax=Trichinella pseudospiralis TaxID=6337 RepID=A0A0V1FNQ3_TRIPS|nr:hypothetical protein T4D_16634 [Trichinella pseudospiralis]
MYWIDMKRKMTSQKGGHRTKFFFIHLTSVVAVVGFVVQISLLNEGKINCTIAIVIVLASSSRGTVGLNVHNKGRCPAGQRPNAPCLVDRPTDSSTDRPIPFLSLHSSVLIHKHDDDDHGHHQRQ